MNPLGIIIFAIPILVFGTMHAVSAQTDNSDNDLVVSDEEKILLFGGFAAAIIGILLFLARDVILRRKSSYEKEEHESQKEKTFEKYHSDWGDDYEELGKRRNTKNDQEFRKALLDDDLPNYYKILGVPTDATRDEIKTKFRELAKKTHPDKTKTDSKDKMAEINKAYEVLSDQQRKESYDKYLK